MKLLLKLWIYFKLFYLYLLYWFVGITQEDFNLSKAIYLADLGFFDSAIKYYEKALSDSKSPLIYASIGWCYMTKGDFNLAEEYYSKAFNKSKGNYYKLGYAISLFHNNNVDKSLLLYQELQNNQDKFSEIEKEYFIILGDLLTKDVV